MKEVVRRPPGLLSRGFAHIAGRVASITGHPLTFMTSCALIALWAIASSIFHLGAVWQSLIGTATTFATFLMVFLIQSTQNRDSAAVQAKLDELVRAIGPANNEFIGIESRTIKEVHELRLETVAEVKKLEELVLEVEAEHHGSDHASGS